MANEGNFFLHATFTVFWLNIAIIAIHSGERCDPWASGFHYQGYHLIITFTSFVTGRGSSIGSEFAWHANGPEFDPHIHFKMSTPLTNLVIMTSSQEP